MKKTPAEFIKDRFLSFIKDYNLFTVLKKLAVGIGSEPIPTLSHKNHQDIIGCCIRVFAGYITESECKDYYPGYKEKATQIFFSLIQSHYLPNGNKRIACIIVYYYIEICSEFYKKEITNISDDALHNLAIYVATSGENNLSEQEVKNKILTTFFG